MLTTPRTSDTMERAIAGICGLASAIAVAVAHRATPLLAMVLIGLVLTSVKLSLIDFRCHRLPNQIVGILAATMTASLLAFDLATADVERFAIAITYAGAAVAGFFVIHLIAGLGMGDVKYAYSIFLTLGWLGEPAVRIGLLVMCLAGSGGAIVCLMRQKTLQHTLAYGPFMTAGLIAGLILPS